MAVVTAVSFQAKDGERVNVFIDGVFYCGMPAITAAEHKLKAGTVIDAETLEKIVEDADSEQAFIKATALVSKLLKTEKEVADWLKNKGYGGKAIGSCIARLKNLKLIDDESYVKAYINSHISSSGRKKLEYELRQRGISSFILEDAFALGEYDFKLNAKKIAEKYIKNKTADKKLLQKAANHLYNRGYSRDEINFALEGLGVTDGDNF